MKKSLSKRAIMTSALLLITAVGPHLGGVRAAIPSFSGDEADYWGHQKRAVIVAVVKEVTTGRKRGELHATLEPRATLAGDFDASLHTRLPVLWWARKDGYESSLGRSPKAGDLVISVVIPPDEERMDPEIVAMNRYVVPVDLCAFMREEEPLVVIQGLDDPEVGRTLKRIQEKRAKVSATQPATRPAK